MRAPRSWAHAMPPPLPQRSSVLVGVTLSECLSGWMKRNRGWVRGLTGGGGVGRPAERGERDSEAAYR
jgi:hypothetical protein